jgi:hypothetical protein
MHTTSAVALLGAGLATATAMTGCVPFGCGGVDPTDTMTFELTAAGQSAAPAGALGIAGAADGVWFLVPGDGGFTLIEYDPAALAETRRIAVDAPGETEVGLAWDGAALWVGLTGGEAWRIDPATGAVVATVALPAGTHDLAWDGARLLAVEDVASIDAIDPATGALVESLPVRQQDVVSAVAFHDSETWAASPANPLLVYDTTGTLMATATSDALAHGVGGDEQLTFVGEDLLLLRGGQVYRYAVAR